MAGTTIDTTVTSTVTLGSASYPGPLIIGRRGGIDPSGFGATGLYVPAAYTGGSILNDGHVFGGNGPGLEFSQINGGVGIDIEGGANLNNYGVIQGGFGGDSFNATKSGNGGYGVVVRAGSSITNHVGIYGGEGGYGHSIAGAGGVALYVEGSSKLTNLGLIAGGYGGESGATGAQGGAGLDMTGGAIASNAGTIAGGQGGYSVEKYTGGANDAQGGYGVILFFGGKLTNNGAIAGGLGGNTKEIFGGAGGGGAFLDAGILLNNDVIGGGQGGLDAAGGDGVATAYGDTKSLIVNNGTIFGGTGGAALIGNFDGDGGAGVYLSGGTLVNAGTIIGALGGHYGLSRSAAVQFGNGVGTLVVKSGAVFTGGVYADSGVADVLELSGKSSQALTGIGYAVLGISGFNNISFAAGAAWTIAGAAAGLAEGQKIRGFTAADKITIADAAAAAGTVKVTANGKVTIEAGGDTYVLDIEGAKKGSKDFKFADFTLTEKKSKTAAMQFITPAAPPAGRPPVLTPIQQTSQAASHAAAMPNGWLNFGEKSLDYGGVMSLVTLSGAG